MNGVHTTVKAILNSYAYEREFDYMIELCWEVAERVTGCANKNSNRTYDGDIIYGFLVLMYGDYGTSPRSGWIDKEYDKEIKDCLYDLIEVYTRLKEEEDEEN